MSDPFQQALLILVAFLLILLTGFFVAAEFALVKVRATRLEELASQKRFGAAKARAALQDINSYLSATQLGITITTLVLGNFGESVFERIVGPAFHGIPRPYNHVLASAVSLGIVTVLEVVIGEIAPKTLAIQRAEQVATAVIYPLDLFRRLFRPLITAMNLLATWVLRPFGLPPSRDHGEEAHSEEELRLILSASHAGGAIKEAELNLVNQVFDFAHRQAKEVMVPRPDVTFLHADHSVAEAIAAADAAGYSRFPLIDGSSDNVVGMVHTKDLLRVAFQVERPDRTPLREIVRPRALPSVPETKAVEDLLREFQRNRQRMAVVVDEYGGTAGIVTLEDLIEEIVGDLQDEFDRTAPEVEPSGTDCWQVDGRMSLDKLRRQLDFSGPSEETEVDTVGGWVLASIEGAARLGTEVPYGEATFTVTEIAGRRIRRVRVCIPEPVVTEEA